jgi:N-carbamoyl-L-amino-acid hydrolase
VLFQRWGEAAGLTLSVDRVGNMVFRRPGQDPSRKAVAIGSRLDTQPTGGLTVLADAVLAAANARE